MTTAFPTPYPFSALVGQDQLRLALILCAVRPDIGGVLIRGEKGTAKSTAVRALASVLADVDEGARLVELPIGATEDRVVGSLDLQRVLRDGEHAFSPGLLARAHGVFATDWPLWLLTAATTLLVWRTKLHLLWLLGAGALLGALGWV